MARSVADRVRELRIVAFGYDFADAAEPDRDWLTEQKVTQLVITEVNPHRDPDGQLAARLAADVAGILAG